LQTSSEYAIRLEGIGKRYRIGQRVKYRTLRESLMGAVLAPARRLRALSRGEAAVDHGGTVWALEDVSFDVKVGESVAIIGRNGAGKSTLLKVLARITTPTKGRAELRGHVGSLLEVGTGFHHELSGRDNVYLNGAILGMKRAEIARKFDEIVAFAELEKFIDTPVKHYSSGMALRLAFAVAAHLEPEILVIDEVLAVGDAAFQQRCIGKMGDVSKQGRTVLFVSHNIAAVQSLCQRGVLLENGRVTKIGLVNEVVDHYLSGVVSAFSEWNRDERMATPLGTHARLMKVRVLSASGKLTDRCGLADSFTLQFEYEVLVADSELNLSLVAHSQDDVSVFTSVSLTDARWFGKPHPVGKFRSQVTLPANFFNNGRYSFSVSLMERQSQVVDSARRAVAIDLVDYGDNRGGYFGNWGGVVRPLLDWNTECIGD
jgi:lipopolysaccharide transport system ATP-binding protein